jgi:hypothetical protein
MRFKVGDKVEMIPGNRHEYQSKGTFGIIDIVCGTYYTVIWECGHWNGYTDDHIRLFSMSNRQAICLLKKD